MNYNGEIKGIQDRIGRIIEEISNERLTTLYRFLTERIMNPQSYVVMFGETSSGKSTLVNGLVGKEIMITKAKPTTGTIVEIFEGSSDNTYKFYAVNRNATLEELDKEMFDSLSIQPDDQLQRLRIKIPEFRYNLKGLRLFDTPGYDSIFKEHEEVLKNFIPESDVIIYVVSYRKGFQENDNDFAMFIQELINDDTEILLVINRVPKGITSKDKRIKEIVQHAEDCTHRKLSTYIVNSVTEGIEEKRYSEVLPVAQGLWQDVSAIVNSEKRRKALLNVLKGYQKDILIEAKIHINSLLINMEANSKERKELELSIEEFMKNKDIVLEKISRVFNKVIKNINKLFDKSCESINYNLDEEINKSNKWTSKDECSGFIRNHMLPLHVRKETIQIRDYVQTELERLDEEINSLLNTAVKDFETRVEVTTPIYTEVVRDIGVNVSQKLAGVGLTNFFKQFGGRGGAGAGVANAAKKALKKVGDAVGKKFSRETHNALAHFLKKIGATSTRAITAAAAVLIEGLFYLYDSITWQDKLVKQGKKAIDKWKDDAVAGIQKDLQQLHKHNDKMINEFFNEYVSNTKSMFQDRNNKDINKEGFKAIKREIQILIDEIDNEE